jgi:hypothetical protein
MRCSVVTLAILFVAVVCRGTAVSEIPNDPYAKDDGNYADGLPGGGAGHDIGRSNISEGSEVEQGSEVVHWGCVWWGRCNAWLGLSRSHSRHWPLSLEPMDWKRWHTFFTSDRQQRGVQTKQVSLSLLTGRYSLFIPAASQSHRRRDRTRANPAIQGCCGALLARKSNRWCLPLFFSSCR